MMSDSTRANKKQAKRQVKEGLSQSHIKLVQSLNSKKGRSKGASFVVEGHKIINELLNTDIKIKTIFTLDAWLNNILETNFPSEKIVLITEKELDKLSFLKHAQSMLAIVDCNSLACVPFNPKKPSIILDDIQDPGNLGTILRTAVWYGIEQVLCSKACADFLNPKVIQASMGAFAHVKVYYEDLESYLSSLEPMAIYGAILNGIEIGKVNWVADSHILIGNESKGINQSLRRYISHAVTIPKYGPMESLNAAMANAILCDRFRTAYPLQYHPS